MDVVEFLKTIYIGDRGCKSILLDGWSSEVKLQVTCISRVRAGAWGYYSSEDVVNGFLVFEGVESIGLEPPGYLPNDLINDVAVESLSDSKKYLFVVSVDSVNASGDRVEVKIRITADSIFLEDPAKPGHRISS